MSSDETVRRSRAICAEVGFDLDGVAPSVIARLQLLAEHSETVADAERMVARARDIFRYYSTAKPLAAFSEVERQIVALGCLFSDLGKTGPGKASASEQRLILEMFAVEGVDDETQPVTQFFATYFPADAEERVRQFAALGLDPNMPLRQFWNLHSTWTLEIVEAAGVPAEAVAAAATHHLLDDVNPENIVAPDRRFTRSFGGNPTFDRAEKLVILLDKYDAVRRRGGGSHEQAIAWLRKRVALNPHFHDDAELSTLIADLDAVLGRESA